MSEEDLSWQVLDADLAGKNAEFIDPKRLAQLVVDADRVLTF